MRMDCQMFDDLKEEDRCKEKAVVRTDEHFLCKDCLMIELDQWIESGDMDSQFLIEKIDID